MSTSVTTATEPANMHAVEFVPLRVTYEEYLAWDCTCTLAEWVAGEVIFHMPPKEYHQRIVVFLTTLLHNFVQLYRLGRVIVAPFTMRALPNGNAREPDVFFLATQHLDRLTAEPLNGPADLVIEVI